mmetsp:Transcript_116203/g.276194  ORF Transcript_116203/g.276194 Transcript_116203/m.276194 type:complete len:242 (+) Transcript_116203:603-1328(+)
MAMVVEGTKLVPGTCLPAKVSAHDGFEVVWVIELLLGTMRVGATEAKRTPLGVFGAGVLLAPVWAQPGSVPDGGGASRILVVVRINASVPLVLHADWTPARLVLVHEKVVSQGMWLLVLLSDGQKRNSYLLAGVCEGAACAAATLTDIWIRGAKAPLGFGGTVSVPLPPVVHGHRHLPSGCPVTSTCALSCKAVFSAVRPPLLLPVAAALLSCPWTVSRIKLHALVWAVMVLHAIILRSDL